MKFCWKCGNQLNDDAVFCDKCGTKVAREEQPETVKQTETKPVNTEPTKKEKQSDGEIYKCPFCGEILPYDALTCPSCGKELRGRDVTNSIQKFVEKLENAADPYKKAELIRNFPIPNSREDIMEFMLLASTNYYAPVYAGEKNRSIEIAAWRTKMDQCYRKAHMLLKDPDDLAQIDALYYGRQKVIKTSESSTGTVPQPKKRKTTPFRVIGIISIPLCVLCSILLIVFFANAVSLHSSPTSNFKLEPEILNSTSTLSGNTFTYKTSDSGGYNSTIMFNSNANAELGSYTDKNYIYHSYGGTTNELTITFNFYNSKTSEALTNYYDLSVKIYTGKSSLSSQELDFKKYQVNGNKIKYSSTDDIYLYSLEISFYDHVVSYEEKTKDVGAIVAGSIFLMLAGVFLASSIVFNSIANKINRNIENEYKDSTLGREHLIREQELEEQRREQERIEQKEREREEREREREEREREREKEREEHRHMDID